MPRLTVCRPSGPWVASGTLPVLTMLLCFALPGRVLAYGCYALDCDLFCQLLAEDFAVVANVDR